eukprot:TRINITY_DN22752_c0_g1_i2.p1 TRINITY_DN22752_c0_g1~~TRINITY_DN22752_c0_g1_i2.p1  ORF type:complete len:128 (+),score=36.47 TRINITY_DN22752_c0_g1_i2:62-445(+)
MSVCFFFFFKQKTAYEMLRSLVGSEMCIRDRYQRRVRATPPISVPSPTTLTTHADPVEVVETIPQPPRRTEAGKAGAPKRRAKPVGPDISSAAAAALSQNNRSLSGSFVAIPTQQPVTSTSVEEFEL